MEYSSKALVATAKASGYLQQLCEHFGHKTEVFNIFLGLLPPVQMMTVHQQRAGLYICGSGEVNISMSLLLAQPATHEEIQNLSQTPWL